MRLPSKIIQAIISIPLITGISLSQATPPMAEKDGGESTHYTLSQKAFPQNSSTPIISNSGGNSDIFNAKYWLEQAAKKGDNSAHNFLKSAKQHGWLGLGDSQET